MLTLEMGVAVRIVVPGLMRNVSCGVEEAKDRRYASIWVTTRSRVTSLYHQLRQKKAEAEAVMAAVAAVAVAVGSYLAVAPSLEEGFFRLAQQELRKYRKPPLSPLSPGWRLL
jgi:hypothetical protein